MTELEDNFDDGLRIYEVQDKRGDVIIVTPIRSLANSECSKINTKYPDVGAVVVPKYKHSDNEEENQSEQWEIKGKLGDDITEDEPEHGDEINDLFGD